MKRILVLTAHPNPSQSHINKRMAAMAGTLADVSVIDLYALYPRFKIDVEVEQERLKAHDVIVFQFPLHWYSTPALLREWQDLVLEHGFAYGPDGTQLAGKLCLLAVTAGGAEQAYSSDGVNQFSIRTLLSPLEQTANLCQMRFLPPLVLFSSLVASQDERAERHVKKYQRLLEALRDEQLDLPRVFKQDVMGVPTIPLKTDNRSTGSNSHG